jgi:hypothetical protein
VEHDKQTQNVLVLELATMVVAIALALAANYLGSFNFRTILYFVFATAVVIWFWWGYVMDRLAYPQRTGKFPLADVFVLIFISLIPFALRQGEVYALSATLAAVLMSWSFMIYGIIRENGDKLTRDARRKLALEVEQRFIVGLLLVADVVIDLIRPDIGFILLFVPGVFAIAWGLVTYFTDISHPHDPQSKLAHHQ